MRETTEIAAELDARHYDAKRAFEHKDLAAYREIFAPDLAWCQADGRIIGRQQLMRDVASQFRRLRWVRSSFARESIEPGDDRVVELLTQTAFAGATAFFFIHRIWNITRKGRYYWTKIVDQWQIDRVEVLEEHVAGHFKFGSRPSIGSD
jgi:Domain of unknown function (DUF4440)